jgi:hypothetical protein
MWSILVEGLFISRNVLGRGGRFVLKVRLIKCSLFCVYNILLIIIKMFNLYEFEKRVRNEEQTMLQTIRHEKLQQNMRSKHTYHLLIIYIERNEEMSKSYKKRVAHFIKDVSLYRETLKYITHRNKSPLIH